MKSKKIKTISIIGMLAMAMLLIPQVAHSLYLFEINSRYQNPWFGWLYAIGVDLAIFIFTIKGWLKTALLYMFVTLAHNLTYLFAPESLWSGILLSVVQSVTLFSFTHLFFKREVPLSTSEEVPEYVLKIQQATNAGVLYRAFPYQCPHCEECFEESRQLNGHISAHKMRKEWQPENYGNWKSENAMRASYL